MGKSKIAATGKGYVGEIMVHRVSGQIGVVESVVEAQLGWPPQVTVKLKDGSTRKGKLSEFREATGGEKRRYNSSSKPVNSDAT